MYVNTSTTEKLSQSAIIRLGKNMPIQGTSADISKYAMMFLYRSLDKTSARLINNIHDELVFEVARDEAKSVAKTIEKEMVAAGQKFIHNVPVLVDIKIAEAWLKQ